jgi:fucose 4-O-acetylase-like acetyltransferase
LIHAAPAAAAAVHADPNFYSGLVRASGLFRMPVFFFIAGFLASHAQVKQNGWLRRRVIQLGVPMFSTWLLLVLPVQYFKIGFFGNQEYNPVHLWFLADLIVFSCVFCNSLTLHIVDTINAKIEPLAAIMLFFFVSGVLAATRYPIAHIPVDVWSANFLQAPADAIFYFGGMVLQRNNDLFIVVQRRPAAYSGIILLALIFPIGEYLQSMLVPHQHRLLKIALAAASGIVAAGMCFSVMASAIRLHSRPRIISRLSQASYSIYLLHLPVITVAAPLLARLGEGVVTTYALLVATSFMVSWLVHELVINRYGPLRFLFNGVLAQTGVAKQGRPEPA